MDHTVVPGYSYAVTASEDCTLTAANGWKLVLKAGIQQHFTAQFDTFTAPVPITLNVNFKRAASVLRLLGGGVKPAWVKELEEALAPQMLRTYIVEYKSGTLFVHSDYEQQEGLADIVAAAAAQYAPEGTPLVQKWLPPVGTTAAQYKEVWRNRPVVLSEKAPVPPAYESELFVNAKITTAPPWQFRNVSSLYKVFSNSEIAFLGGIFMFPDITTSTKLGSHGIFYNAPELVEIPETWTFEKLEYGSEFASSCKKLRRAHGLNLHSLKEGNNFMSGTQVDKKTALLVLLGIPDRANPEMDFSSTSGKLAIGVHLDFSHDSEIAEAIAEAEVKGWTLTVQWNGTAGEFGNTTRTFALRRRMPVFARLGEPLADGTQRLDWGHYVTNAEENGYTEFTSLEEAKEHFNIKDDEQ